MNIELDPIDLKIIALLKQDSRLTNKEIGQRVHRTGQAVGARIAQLMDAGVIKITPLLCNTGINNLFICI